MTYETQYLNILEEILTKGIHKENRTGIDTLSLFSRTIRHDMSDGFPLLTTRQMPYKSTWVELEGFIKGIISKKWYKERGCHYWDFWVNPQKVPYAKDEATKALMRAEDDLGPTMYGASWRSFHDPRINYDETHGNIYPETRKSVDQLKNIVNKLKSDPNDRRMVCFAHNPLGTNHCALVPCHMGFLVNVLGGKLNLAFWQRSCDFICNQSFVTYATLLHLLCLESGFELGEVVGHYEDCHVYLNHVEGAKEQLARKPFEDLPRVETANFSSIFDWTNKDSRLIDYQAHPKIKFEVAI